MPKNLKGGNKTKKFKRGYSTKEAIDKLDDGQMFGRIEANMGDKFSVLCSDNICRLGRLSRGAKRGQRLIKGSFVAISLRDFVTKQNLCDIIGAAVPPQSVYERFKNKTTLDNDCIDFYKSDDEFDITESKTVINTSVPDTSTIFTEEPLNDHGEIVDGINWMDI